MWAVVFGSILFFGSAPLSGAKTEDQTNISKKIFAQELASALNLKSLKPIKCFSDLNKKDTATPWICALKKAKIIIGSTTSKFKPEENTNWEFAIKTFCKAQKWTKKIDFKTCTSFARKNGLLSSPLPEKLSSKTLISAEEIDVLLQRIYGKSKIIIKESPPEPKPETKKSEEENVPVGGIPKENLQTLNFEPVKESSIDKDFFEKIALTNTIPNTFYLNEAYFVEGDLVNANEKEVLIFMCRKNQGCDNSLNFIKETNGNHFKIPVYFKETGNFQIGVIPGRSGQSIVASISVLPGPPLEPEDGTPSTTLNVSYNSGETTFGWNGDGAISRLIIFQNNLRRDYIFRQKINSFAPPPEDFAEFKKGSAGWTVKQNSLQSETQAINLTTKDFRKIETNKIQINTLQEVFQTPGHFAFYGKALAPISKKAAVTLPTGQVKEIIFAEQDLASGTGFKIETDFETAGTYIFEVNDPEGGAVVNVPIYIGSSIPLLPDFFALNKGKLDKAPISNLNEARQKLLSLINIDRANHSLPPVSLSSELNAIAQGHSENMVKLNFFGHVDPSGKAPEDRRKAAKFPISIKENLAKSATLELAQAGLMRSPIHRILIIDPTITQVGLGIAKNAEGYLFVTQNFAGKILTKSDLPALENELFSKLNDKRLADQLPFLFMNSTLNSVAGNWAQRMADEGFFNDTAPNGDTIVKLVRDQGVKSGLQMHILETNSKEQLETELFKQPGITNIDNKSVGVGLGLNEIGEFFMAVIYAQ